MRCAIWYHLRNLKNVKNAQRGELLLVKLQASACNFNKTLFHGHFFHVFWIVQMVPNREKHHISNLLFTVSIDVFE